MINSPHCYLICSYAVSRSLLSEAEQEDQQTAQKAAKFGLVRLQQLPSYVKRNVKEKFFMRILGHRGSLSATQYRQEFSSRVSKNFSRTRSLITARVVCRFLGRPKGSEQIEEFLSHKESITCAALIARRSSEKHAEGTFQKERVLAIHHRLLIPVPKFQGAYGVSKLAIPGNNP